MKRILVAQSGGPTSAINATLYGVFSKAKECNLEVFAAKHGIAGLLNGEIFNLTSILKGQEHELLIQTPASIMRSCRKKLKDYHESEEEYEELIAILRKFEISYFIYIGGNDSMDTVDKISEYFKIKNINDIIVVGAPKTIDNDLCEIDHCPGFGSAAKFVATTFAELQQDCAAYPVKSVTIVEVMGRDAGWLTAASALSRLNGSPGPNLIYCCEKKFRIVDFLSDIEKEFKIGNNSVLIAVSEGIKDEDESYVNSMTAPDCNKADDFGHKIVAGAAAELKKIVQKEFGCRVRAIELSLMQRCAAHVASLTDLKESVAIGEKAVELALNGESGMMAAMFRKKNEPYEIEFGFVEAKKVANKVKKMPKEMLDENKNDVTSKAIEYLKPLIAGEPEIKFKNGIPVHVNLWKN